VISAVLTALAIPLIAVRTGVRADLFTTLLSAAYLALLWRYHKTGRARLWLLPVLMILWVNAHLGFFLGLGLIGGYILVRHRRCRLARHETSGRG
jgi:predicted membrane-bound mannosyltransferase